MKSGASMQGSSASEYLIYFYKRVLWEWLTTSISWNLAWKCLIFAHIFVSLCCYNPFIAIFTVVITHRGNFILYLMPYTLRHRMAMPSYAIYIAPGHPPSLRMPRLIGVFAMWRTKHLLTWTAKTLIRLRVWQNQQNNLCAKRSLRSAWPSAPSVCEGPNIYWCGQRRLWPDWEHYKTNKMTCVPNEASVQPGYPPSLISVFAMWRTKHLLMWKAKTDQTQSMIKPTKWPVHPAKSQISLAICPVWSASSLCEGPNIYWCGQRRFWSDWEDAHVDQSLRWAHMQYCWFCYVTAHFRSNFSQTPNIPLHIW